MENATIEKIVNEKKCTGCRACYFVCPMNAITFRTNEEGFAVPTVAAEKCVECSKCIRRCPETVPIKRYSTKTGIYFIVQGKERKSIKKSASGGAFYTIAKYVIHELEGVVFGASFDDSNVVRHIYADKISGLQQLQNSKYVQSDIGETFEKVKEFLEKGRYVFFTGTPCQVAGLHAYLGKNIETLFTADLICHGVPSPMLLKRQLEEVSHSWKGKIKGVRFRYKNPLFCSSSFYYMIMKPQHGLPIVRNPKDDPYFNIFSKGIGFRESCYKCQYANRERVGDFTFGDCDSHSLYPEFHPNEANSCLLLNSEKAQKIWETALNRLFDYTPLDLTKEEKYNKQLHAPSVRPDARDEVYKDLQKLPWKHFAQKYAGEQTAIRRVKAYLALILPPAILKRWGRK